MLLVSIPWAQRVWALPFWTALAPSANYSQPQGKAHKTLSDWGRQMLLQVRRWLHDREMVVVGDSSFAVLELLDALMQGSQFSPPASSVPHFTTEGIDGNQALKQGTIETALKDIVECEF